MCTNSTRYKVGDIVLFMYNFSASFPVFYEVTGVTAKSVRVRPIGKNYLNIAPGFGSYDCTPNREKIEGRDKWLRITPDGFIYASYYSYKFALRRWDGRPLSGYSD